MWKNLNDGQGAVEWVYELQGTIHLNTSFASPLPPLEAKFSIIKNKLFNGHCNRGKGVLCTYIMEKLVFGWQIFTSKFLPSPVSL